MVRLEHSLTPRPCIPRVGTGFDVHACLLRGGR